MPRPPIVLLVGPPGVGKTTTSRALAARHPLAVHIPVDDLRMMVASGFVLPTADWPPELARQIRLGRESAIDMALRYRDDGFAAIIDDFWDPHGLAEYRDLFARPDTYRVVLAPTLEEARRRNRIRGGSGVAYIEGVLPYAYEILSSVLPSLPPDEWLVLDNGPLTPEQTANAIEAFIAHRAGG